MLQAGCFHSKLLTTRPTDHMVEGHFPAPGVSGPSAPRTGSPGLLYPRSYTISRNPGQPDMSPWSPSWGELRRMGRNALMGGLGDSWGDNRWKQSLALE